MNLSKLILTLIIIGFVSTMAVNAIVAACEARVKAMSYVDPQN